MNFSSASSMRREERLAHGPKGEVWRVRTPAGAIMIARQIGAPTRGERAQLLDLTRRSSHLSPPLVPFTQLVDTGDDVWLVREFDPGVPLANVGAMAPLSHRQAAGTAAACLNALAQLHDAGLCHGRVHAGNVFVEPDGAIRLVDAGIGSARNRGQRRSLCARDLTATAALVYTVWPDWEYEAGHRVHELLVAGRMGDAAAAREGLELLAASLPPADRRPDADLAMAALSVRLLESPPPPVARVSSPPPPAPPAAPAPTAPPSPTPPPASPDPARRPGAVFRWEPSSQAARPLRHLESWWRDAVRAAERWPEARAQLRSAPIGWVVGAMVAAALLFAAAYALASPMPHVAQVAGPSAQGAHASAGSHGPAPGTAQLQPAAPASAGFVQQMQLAPVGSCQSGGDCVLKSVLNLAAPHDSTAITWEVVAVDRCTGAQSVLRSATTTPDPTWNTLWTTDRYAVPSTHPTLLYAVTVTPWRVASSPVATSGATACASGA